MSTRDKPEIDLRKYLDRVDEAPPARVRGRVRELTGLVMKAAVPGVTVGELVEVERPGRPPLLAQAVGFRDELMILMPLGDPTGIGPDSPVRATGEPLTIRCGPSLRGRVLDGLGQPIDGLGPIQGVPWAVNRPAPPPLSRPRVLTPFQTGVRAIDGLTTLGVGQRVGLFAGSGVGKSTLLGQIARGADADVVVIGLVGERGREVADFIETCLGPEGQQRAVVVCATSDQPTLIRVMAAHVATSIAEYFRDQGLRVLLLMDSLTRYARAMRELGLAAGEPPARRGYPPSVFHALPALLERAGNAAAGTITAIYTVLVEGEDMDEPIADEVRAIVDGHVVLTRALASRSHWPPIDVLRSLSRLMDALVDKTHRDAAAELRRTLAAFEDKRDLVALGAYRRGGDRLVDFAIEIMPEIEAFLQQPQDALTPMAETVERLLDLVG